MAKYKANICFGGIVSMHAGEVKEISNADVAKDLLKAGYIEEVKPAEKVKPTKAKVNKEPTSRARKSGGK